MDLVLPPCYTISLKEMKLQEIHQPHNPDQIWWCRQLNCISYTNQAPLNGLLIIRGAAGGGGSFVVEGLTIYGAGSGRGGGGGELTRVRMKQQTWEASGGNGGSGGLDGSTGASGFVYFIPLFGSEMGGA